MLLRFPHLKPYLVPLEMGKYHVVDDLSKIFVDSFKKKNKSKFKSISTNQLADNKVRIRFIDANHCPGAAMILITGPFGNVLHTGDFRYGGARMIENIGIDHHINYLYLDNTFCTPEEDFPAQTVAYHHL